jgi:hypothetical protein
VKSGKPKKSASALPASPRTPSTAGITVSRKKKALYDGPISPDVGHIRGKIPHARDGHSATVVGNLMVIFGGDRHQMPFNDVYTYSM